MRYFNLLSVMFAISLNNFASAKCMNRANLYPDCRYPAGDSWCSEHRYNRPYAYRDSCLRTLRRVKRASHSNSKIPLLNSISSLHQGMRYSKARKILIRGGWQGVIHRWQDVPSGGRTHDLYYDNGWTEVADCAGTGLGQCEFEFIDMFGDTLKLITVGDCIDNSKKCDLSLGYWSVKKSH